MAILAIKIYIFTTKSLINLLYLGLQNKANIVIWRFFFFFRTSGDWNPTKSLHFWVFKNFEYLFLTKFRQLKKKKALRWQHLHASTCSSALGWLRATLDEGPRSRDQWIQAILLVETFKLVPKAFRQGSKTQKSGNLRLNLHGTSFGGKINWFGLKKKTVLKWRAPDLENQRIVC